MANKLTQPVYNPNQLKLDTTQPVTNPQNFNMETSQQLNSTPNYSQQQIDQWHNSSDYADISNKFLMAQRNEDVNAYNGLQNEATASMAKMFAPQPVQPKVQPNFGYIDEADKARQAMIQARLAEQLGAQDGMIRDAEGNLVKQTGQIHQNTYNQNETAKANSVNKGIQYSQQQQGIENGVARNGIKMIVDAGQERDKAILNIKDRIASLKSGASYEMQASQAQADAEKGKVTNDYNMRQEDRQWQLDDIQSSYDRQDYVTDDTRKYEAKLLEDNKAYADKILKEGYTREDAVRVLEMGDKVKLLDIDNKYKVAFLDLDTQAQLKVMGVKNVHELKMQSNEITAQKIITGMNNATQIKSANIGASASIQNNILDNATSRLNNGDNIAQSNKENTDRISAQSADNKAKAEGLKNEFLNNLLKNDPTFNPYGIDAKSIAQREYLAKLNGVDVLDITNMLGKDFKKSEASSKKIVEAGKTSLKVGIKNALFGMPK